MTIDLSDKVLLTATFDRVIDVEEGQNVAKEMERKLQDIDPDARLSSCWLDVQPGQTIVHMAFTPVNKLREALMPVPPEEWPTPGEVTSIIVSGKEVSD